jgi:hypothetical protein
VPNPIVAFQRDDAPGLQPSEMPRADVEVVSPAVFGTLRLDILAGRALTDGDGADSARVAVVSQTAARRFWPDRDPVGATIRFGTDTQAVRAWLVPASLSHWPRSASTACSRIG